MGFGEFGMVLQMADTVVTTSYVFICAYVCGMLLP